MIGKDKRRESITLKKTTYDKVDEMASEKGVTRSFIIGALLGTVLTSAAMVSAALSEVEKQLGGDKDDRQS